MDTLGVRLFATGIGLIALTAARGGPLGIPGPIRLGLIALALVLLAGLLVYARRFASPTPPPPPPPPPKRPTPVRQVAPPVKGRTGLPNALFGIPCPDCGNRFTTQTLPQHMLTVHDKTLRITPG
jgi:hypothetical protein